MSISLTQSPASSEEFPTLPLRDIVVFPRMVVPLFVGREKSVKALEKAQREQQQILLATQRDSSQDDPKPEEIYTIGTLAKILQLLKLPDGTVKVLVEGQERVRLLHYTNEREYYQARCERLVEVTGDEKEVESLRRAVTNQFEQYIKVNKKIPPEVLVSVNQIAEPGRLADAIAAHLGIKIGDKQALLESLVISERLEKIFGFMEGEIGVLQVEKRIRSRVKRQMERTQREYYLNEQLKAIQKELGESEDGKDENSEIEEKLKTLKLSKEAREKGTAELKKLRNMSPIAAEATVVRNYLDWLVSLPWDAPSKVKNDLVAANDILDEDHFGLEKVKERILEYLAVQSRTKKMKGPILCIVGPPGVGKTSLAKSIAKATGRSFVRMSLGGVRDEAEVRGHRRTYIGSLPGKIIQGMKKAKHSNPLFLLDEVDKMGSDWRGDPASALLEVLDPEQNGTFNDHYLELDYDLSDVMFITTANSLRMPQPLLDRMEIIRIAGYTEDEKLEISRRHLIPKQVAQHGLQEGEFAVEDAAIRDLVRYYTREAGVRNLEREIANLARKAVKEIVMAAPKSRKAAKMLAEAKADAKATKKKTKKAEKLQLPITITAANLEKYAGVRKFHFGEVEQSDMIGVVVGLAWTETGGELLTIESVTVPGKGRVHATGKLGDVMKESVQAAESFVKSRAHLFGIERGHYEKRDIHVHVPEGATPKDGPSAGVAMVTSIVSVLTGIPVRRDVAMTGEVTLRGRVLPIGGLKEKLLAASRGGIKTVIIPSENQKDLADIPDSIKNSLTIMPVSQVEEVLTIALLERPVAIPLGSESEHNEGARPIKESGEKSAVITH